MKLKAQRVPSDQPAGQRLSPELVDAIDAFRKERQVSPAEALRMLIELGLAAYDAHKATRLREDEDADALLRFHPPAPKAEDGDSPVPGDLPTREPK